MNIFIIYRTYLLLGDCNSQYAVIDFLSQFQSEEPGGFISTAEPFFSLSELCAERPQQVCLMDVDRLQDLRGPPQA